MRRAVTLLRFWRKSERNNIFEKASPIILWAYIFGFNKQMKDGKIPGWSNIFQFYKDGIHLNEPVLILLLRVFYNVI
jgi:hypothetical protein